MFYEFNASSFDDGLRCLKSITFVELVRVLFVEQTDQDGPVLKRLMQSLNTAAEKTGQERGGEEVLHSFYAFLFCIFTLFLTFR